MKLFSKAAVGGLLWLSFSGMALFGDTLTGVYQTYDIDDPPTYGGGQFMGTLNGTQTITVYCIDFANDLSLSDTVNVSGLSNISDTRYGNTPTSDFTFFDGTSASNSLYTGPTLTAAQLTLTADQRYLLAAYLVTQYNLAPSPTPTIVTQDSSIQGAIWDLLNTTTTTFTSNNESAYLTQAVDWLTTPANSAAIATLSSEVSIYTPVSLSGPGNSQELIGITTTPEPQTLAMLGLGLVALGLFRKGRRA